MTGWILESYFCQFCWAGVVSKWVGSYYWTWFRAGVIVMLEFIDQEFLHKIGNICHIKILFQNERVQIIVLLYNQMQKVMCLVWEFLSWNNEIKRNQSRQWKRKFFNKKTNKLNINFMTGNLLKMFDQFQFHQ